MKKIIVVLAFALVLTLLTTAVAFADPPKPACNGLDKAHEELHSSGTEGELALHDLRLDNLCDHP